MKEKERRVAVIGLGASGEAAARLALAKGAEVHVSDASDDPAVAARAAGLRELGADVRLGGHPLAPLASADTVVASPGIPPTAPVFAALRARGVGWISEPEFASRFLPGPLIVVTGTNGKTTTAAMTAHLLAEAGLRTALGGNVGGGLAPPASALAEMAPPPERIVLELSSYQLAGTRQMKAAVGVMTNLAADHVDRYGSVAAYHADKRRLFDLGGDATTWVLNADDPAVLDMGRDAPGTRLFFSLKRPAAPGAWISGRDVEMDLSAAGLPGERPERSAARVAGVEDVGLVGSHNRANALAALLAAAAAGADPLAAAAALGSFAPLPHRLEPVGVVDGVRWVNDSKATNVAAARSALEGIEGPVVLLLGGEDKGEDFGGLAPHLVGKARAVVTYGAAGGRAAAEIARALRRGAGERAAGGGGGQAGKERDAQGGCRGGVHVEVARGGFEDAVACGRAAATAGDALLLSPACASFDMFPGYEARGEAFRALAGRAGR